MARIRSVHPDICVSDTLAGLDAELERTFVRLWTHCDDEGRCRDNPKLIKAALYPLHDDVTWERLDVELDCLDAKGLIVRYEVAGQRYLAVRSWGEYQHPQRAKASNIPPPEDGRPREPSPTPPSPGSEESRNGTRPVREPSRTGEGVGEGVGVGGEREIHTSSLLPALAVVPDAVSPPATRAPIDTVFTAWQDATGHHRARLDDKRRRLIQRALKTYPPDDLVDAVRGWRNSPFHAGQNESHRTYNDLSLLLRDAEHIERFRDLERHGPPPVQGREPRSFAALRRIASETEPA